jgi:hypothetical protein
VLQHAWVGELRELAHVLELQRVWWAHREEILGRNLPALRHMSRVRRLQATQHGSTNHFLI